MTVMALALAREREHEAYTLENECMYDSSGEVVGWLGQVMDDGGYRCEHMGMGDDGYTSCWSSSEMSRLREENAKLSELVSALYGSLLFSCSECWSHKDLKTCDNTNCGNHKTYQKMRELGIEFE